MSRPLAMFALLLSVTVSHAQETKPPPGTSGKTGVKRSGRSSTGKANRGAGVTDRAKPRAKTKKPNATRRTVLVESASWNVEADRVTRGSGGDLLWKRIEKRGIFLIPTNGARLRLLSTKKFAATSMSHLSRVKYRTDRISAARLQPGTVVAVRTSAGNFVKLRVVGYRKAKDLANKHPQTSSKDARHLELEWVLYQAPYKTTVLLGTWAWDLESNRQGRVPGADLFWEQVNEQVANLKPMNGAGVRKVDGEFNRISAADLVKLAYDKKPIANKDLKPGTVLAIQTSEGRFGKLRIKRYRALHDFSFPEAKYLSKQLKTFILGKPNQEKYHLEIQWMLFGREKAGRKRIPTKPSQKKSR